MASLPTELAPPSVIKPSYAFAGLHMLLVEPDQKQGLITKKLLFGLGCERNTVVRSGEEALEFLQTDPCDIVLTGWDMKGMSGLELTSTIRQNPRPAARTLPIVMMSDRLSLQEVLLARDSGINEYVVRPYAPKSLLERLYMVVENPRSFVLSRPFIGPDRRRVNATKQVLEVEKTKAVVKRKPPRVVSKQALEGLAADEGSYMVLPDFSLKEKIGLHVPERIKLLTKITDDSMSDEKFSELMLKEVEGLQQSLSAMRENPEMVDVARKQLVEASQVIKNASLARGYFCAFEFADLLYGFCTRYLDVFNQQHHFIIEKHTESLQVIFQKRYAGDAGGIGEALLQDLTKLIRKYMG